jgi:PKD repeat protein
VPAVGPFLQTWPPCIDVAFEAHDVTGIPPFTFVWEISNGLRLPGNPATLLTQQLPAGFYSAQLAVTNPFGTSRNLAPIYFTIEDLRFAAGPSCQPAGNRAVLCDAGTEGAVEHQWEWGDGQISNWRAGCPGRHGTHTYARPGTYTVRLRARNCRDGAITRTLTVQVTQEAPLDLVDFAALCPTGFCLFTAGQAVGFRHTVNGTPQTWAYDWNGDGLVDQVAGTSVASHVYPAAGTYWPRLTVTQGTQVDSAVVPIPVTVLPGSSAIFADGFESGGLSRWSQVVSRARRSPK